MLDGLNNAVSGKVKTFQG